jgi:hypothetical protein
VSGQDSLAVGVGLAFVLCSAGCYTGGEGDTGSASDWPGTGESGETEAGTGSESDGADETGAEDEDPPQDYPEEDCDYVLVDEQPGLVHTVSGDASTFDVMPLDEGEGFFCLRVEFDLSVPDDLDALLAEHEGCPEYLALASVFGTQPSGEYLATSFFHAYEQAEDACVASAPHVEVGNYIDYQVGHAGPWLPGGSWHVVLEAKPWLTRIDVAGEGGETHRVEASLYPANVADTRDPVVRLGQAQVTGQMFFPWFGAEYSNLKVEAVVAGAP